MSTGEISRRPSRASCDPVRTMNHWNSRAFRTHGQCWKKQWSHARRTTQFGGLWVKEGLHRFIPLSEVEEQPDAHCERAIESDTESCE